MNSENTRRKWLKIGLSILVIIIILLAGIQIFLSFYLDDIVESRLMDTVSEQSNNQYELNVGELSLSVWNRQIELNDVRLLPTNFSSTAPKVELERFSINGIQFFPYLFSGAVKVGDVELINPVVTIVEDSPDSLTFLQSSDRSSGSSKSRNIEVSQILVENGSLRYWNEDQSNIRGELNNFHLDISDIRVDSTTQLNPPFFDFNSVQTKSGKIRYLLNNDLYAIETNGFDISTSGALATIDSLKLVPQLPKYEFSRKVGYQQDRISLTVAGLRLENPDVEKLKAGEIQAKKVVINKADLEVFHSKLLREGPQTEKIFPQMAFKNLRIPISIDTIAISQSEIRYSEHRPNVSEPGAVTFANVNATFSGVTNDSIAVSQGHKIILDVTSDVMGAAKLNAHFELPMNENGGHSARGTLTSMQAKQLNPILEPVGLVRAERGTIHSLQFLMDLGADSASGWVQLVYSDLRVSVLDSDHVNSDGRKWLKTFLANVLKIKRNNNKEPFRRGEVSMERVPTKSIFSYWWKSLATGLKDNVGM